VLKECIDLIAGVAMQRGIKVLSQDVATGSCLVRADRFRLKQAILNLLSNAVKYNRDNGFVSISMERAGDGRLGLCIEDTGRGLTEQQLQQLFEPFNRLGAEQTAVQGTGIGLAITKRIVELMDGSITAVSAPGQGSTFRIELVTSAVGQSTAAAEASRRMADYGEETPRTILYVEDNPANLRLMAQLLARRPNITLLSAHTGNWGLEFALAQRPDLIILDINLPGMGGFEVLAQLRLHPETRHIPVIAVSADAMPWDIERGLTAGFAYYLSKPLDIEELRQILNEILPPECSLEKTNIKERVQNG
jgi:CheY-like chemotaxis protein